MASGWQRASYFRRHGRELVSKPTISLKKSWGGYRRTTLFYVARELYFEQFPATHVSYRLVTTTPSRQMTPNASSSNPASSPGCLVCVADATIVFFDFVFPL